MHQILADLVAEQQALDQFLQTIRDRDWKTATPAPGWDVRDHVSHLASSEEYALDAVEADGARLAEALAAAPTIDAFNQAGVEPGRAMRPQEVIEWWRQIRARVVDALSRRDVADRIPWLHSPMSARTFATDRLMETWAHGLDIHDTFDQEPEDTPRLRHIAWLGWKSLPYAMSLDDAEYPDDGIRVEVIGPDYAKYVFGPDGTPHVISGTAGEWCRVAVRRRATDATSLKATSDEAAEALRAARAYV